MGYRKSHFIFGCFLILAGCTNGRIETPGGQASHFGLSFVNPLTGATISDSRITVSGLCYPSATLDMTYGSDTVPVSSPSCDSEGNFSFEVDFSGTTGTRTLTASQTIPGATTESATLNLNFYTLPVLDIYTPTENQSISEDPTSMGSCSEENETVTLSYGSGISGSFTTTCTSGMFSGSTTLTGSAGTRTITASQTNPAGTGTITRTFNYSPTPVVITFPTGDSSLVSEGNQSLTGTCADGAINLNYSSGYGASGLTAGSCTGGGFFFMFNVAGYSDTWTANVSQNDQTDTHTFNYRLPWNLTTGFDGGSIYAVAVANDGKIYVGGEFNSLDGVTVPVLTRLNKDGSVDGTFSVLLISPNVGNATATIRAIEPIADGSVYIGGDFASIHDGLQTHFRENLARLNQDGTVDTAFDVGPDITPGPNRAVLSIESYDGGIFIGGEFSSMQYATTERVAKITSSGSLVSDFDCSAITSDGHVRTLALINDGEAEEALYLGGDFSGGVARVLTGDCTSDIAPSNIDGIVYSVVPASDGSGDFYVGGDFSYNTTLIDGIVRLNSNGIRDTDYNVGTNGASGGSATVTGIVSLSDKTCFAGDFNTYRGSSQENFVCTATNGTRDEGFSGVNDDVAVVAKVPGKDVLYLGGEFSQYAGASTPNLIRVNPSGNAD